MATYNISLNDELAQLVEASIKQGYYANRSEFFRSILRNYYQQEGIIVESLAANDADYKEVQKMKNDSSIEFVDFNNVMNEAA